MELVRAARWPGQIILEHEVIIEITNIVYKL